VKFDIVDLSASQKAKLEKRIAWFFLIFGSVGMCVCTPLWLLGILNDKNMLGLTLFLSWLAIVIPGFNAVVLSED
jgi:hypothetical protein